MFLSNFYKTMGVSNEKRCKTITITNDKYANISNQIFEFNQKRFRIKNWFNLITSSHIKEQKSYLPLRCKIMINDISIFYDKIPEIYYLSLEYDVVTIISKFNSEIKQIITIPTINYDDYDDISSSNIILDNFCLDSTTKLIFDATNI